MNVEPGYTVVVLAGGLGTRLNEIVNDVPKPLAPVKGRPFLEYLLTYWANNNACHFILSVGYKHQKIIDHFGSSFQGVPVTYVIENEPLGTGGALLKVLNECHLENDFFLINGDTLFLINPEQMNKLHASNKASFSMSLRKIDNAGRYHRMHIDAAGKLLSINPPDNKDESGLINGGVYIINPDLFSNWPDIKNECISLENDILPKVIMTNNVYGFLDNGCFIDIGIPDDFHKAQNILSEDLIKSEGAY